jgi:hypothetical protein
LRVILGEVVCSFSSDSESLKCWFVLGCVLYLIDNVLVLSALLF